ncbi:type I-C CRISPR-associated protein Cas5c [Neorhodopirellula lusitana]|uniref:type I-C CRISPR-associated protein Cas5c n=1 Tax=Neorhodopirellula lusitana TaxID=445327 RepID=UPI00384E9F07
MAQIHIVEFRGDFGCWSRPEASVERFSYPIPPPSGCRGLLDAIYFHPEFRWEIQRVESLSFPQWIALRRNEVKERVNLDAVKKWIDAGDQPEPILADADKSMTGSDERGRTQRQTMALVRPHFRIHAVIRPWPEYKKCQKKFDEVFSRRMKRGQCFHQPAMGQREFVAYFSPATDKAPVPYSQDLGLMVYDTFDQSRPGTKYDGPCISLFQAKMVEGVVEIPTYESKEVLKPQTSEVV